MYKRFIKATAVIFRGISAFGRGMNYVSDNLAEWICLPLMFTVVWPFLLFVWLHEAITKEEKRLGEAD